MAARRRHRCRCHSSPPDRPAEGRRPDARKRPRVSDLRASGHRSKPRADRKPRGYAGGGAAAAELGPVGIALTAIGVARDIYKHHRAKECEKGNTEYCDDDED